MRMPVLLRKYIAVRSAAVAIWFGVSIPLVISAVGMSVDLGQSFLVHERLSHALDAAALAAAATSSSSSTSTQIERKVQDFVNANYPPDRIGFTTDIDVVNTSKTISVSATAEVKTAFMKVFGHDTVEVYAETEVTKEVKSIEVVLVMDVTGSMSTNNNIAALRTAATNFVNTLLPSTLTAKEKEGIKIGLVPFSSSVNVGTYGLGKTPSGANYGTKFVNNPSNLSYSTSNANQWGGCILESTSASKDTIDHVGPWDLYRYCRTSSGAVINNCDTTRSGRSPNYTYTANQAQNYLCPKTPVVPMTNNATELKNSIATLTANGNTYINNGLTWGLRLISPEAPFREGVAWNNEDWTKAVVLMTDGESTMHPYYSIYGPTANHSIDAGDLDGKITQVCNILKQKKVLVYTITFYNDVPAATKNIFKNCATQPSMWYDAPTQAKLLEVYSTIARELANLHISK